MDRLLQSQGGTLNAAWERDGADADPGSVTVVVTRSDGTQLASGSATGTGSSRSFVLSPAQTTQLDYLTVTWTGSGGSVLTTYADIVGGFLFSIDRARTRSPLQDTAAYPTESLLFYRILAEQALEDVCGVAFVPRFSKDIASVRSAGRMLEVPRRRIRSVRAIYTTTDNAGLVALPTLAGLRVESSGLIYVPQFWSWYAEPITVAYEHGYNEVPFRVSRAALELTRRWLIESPWDERMTSFRTREGGQMNILTATDRDAFDIPEVNAVAELYGTPMVA